MKKPVIDFELCIGCGSCVEVCPEVFELREDEKAYVIAPDKCNTCDCQDAANICPSEAITFEE
ncbi:MAG: ferredoxin [Nitrospirota bacterium]